MKRNTYEFEVQNCVKVQVEANSKDEARMILVDNPDLYQDKIMEDCCISDGRECSNENN